MSKVTISQIKYALLSNDRAVEKAMVLLYHRQTVDERSTSSTKHTNGRGFKASDAKLGTYYARWVLSKRRLSGHHLIKARAMALHYSRQLLEEAQLKQAREAATPVPA